jgi:hypothetical protein
VALSAALRDSEGIPELQALRCGSCSGDLACLLLCIDVPQHRRHYCCVLMAGIVAMAQFGA